METIPKTTALFIAGFGPIVIDAQASRELYSRAFGIPFKEEKGGYLHTESLKGANTFALCKREISTVYKRSVTNAMMEVEGHE